MREKLATQERVCIVSRNLRWADSLRRHLAPDWRITRLESLDAHRWSGDSSVRCLLVHPLEPHEYESAARLPTQLWRRELAIPVVLFLDDSRRRSMALEWESGAASVLSIELPLGLVRCHIEQLIRRWQPLREAADGIWLFQRQIARLSPRERIVMDRLTDGWWIKRIAQSLGTSPNTVRNQRASVLKKLNLDSEKDLIRLALTARWLQAFASARGLLPPQEL